MANKLYNTKTGTPPSPGLGRGEVGREGKDGTENWTHKNGSNIFAKGKGGFKSVKIHAVSSN